MFPWCPKLSLSACAVKHRAGHSLWRLWPPPGYHVAPSPPQRNEQRWDICVICNLCLSLQSELFHSVWHGSMGVTVWQCLILYLSGPPNPKLELKSIKKKTPIMTDIVYIHELWLLSLCWSDPDESQFNLHRVGSTQSHKSPEVSFSCFSITCTTNQRRQNKINDEKLVAKLIKALLKGKKLFRNKI